MWFHLLRIPIGPAAAAMASNGTYITNLVFSPRGQPRLARSQVSSPRIDVSSSIRSHFLSLSLPPRHSPLYHATSSRSIADQLDLMQWHLPPPNHISPFFETQRIMLLEDRWWKESPLAHSTQHVPELRGREEAAEVTLVVKADGGKPGHIDLRRQPFLDDDEVIVPIEEW